MKIGSTEITDIKVGSTQITKVIRNGITYWEAGWTPQSLVVEDAQLTHIVMTGTVANTNAVASDFTISGFIVNSLSRDGTNKILTLTLSTSVVYGDILNVVYLGRSYSVTNNVVGFFITTWNTENVGSATKTIVIPTFSNGYDCVVDWGDGTTTPYVGGTLNTAGTITHIYATTGIKTVSISGIFPQIYFNSVGDKLKLLTIAQWGTGVWRQMAGAFAGCANMIGTYTDYPNTSQVVYMSNMFNNCRSFNQSVANFDTSQVTDMEYMFINCRIFNQSVANFDTSQVTIMCGMFSYCYAFNQSVANFDTSQVLDMSLVFANCRIFNQSVSNFDISNVGTMLGMFSNCSQYSTINYDALLIAWSALLSLQSDVLFDMNNTTKYSAGGAAAARGILTGTYGWTIMDGGQI